MCIGNDVAVLVRFDIEMNPTVVGPLLSPGSQIENQPVSAG